MQSSYSIATLLKGQVSVPAPIEVRGWLRKDRLLPVPLPGGRQVSHHPAGCATGPAGRRRQWCGGEVLRTEIDG